jgi:biopolymer transport protein ExbD
MAFGSFEQNNQQPMSEINTTPMVDVMLVLLIIFMITAPLMTQSIGVNLPSAEGAATAEKPEMISLQISADGTLSWNNNPVDEKTLKKYLADAGQQQPQPEIHLFADESVRYEHVARVMAQARDAGVTQLGFVMKAGDVP